jgi:hypothetical protein
MPGFTLRLTDEQHAALTADAKRNSRSLQGEVIHRLFPPADTPESVAEKLQAARSVLDAAERHFRPDPKPQKVEKPRRR